MPVHLHKQATTTPEVRASIQASDEPASSLAEKFGEIEQNVYKWRHRDSVEDRIVVVGLFPYRPPCLKIRGRSVYKSGGT
ncbi:hypothetical protein CLV88_1232 [Shimia abyssi]|uniref:Transposase n=1 Tax=Shimia abyssi TaxID=1662395 RepID=A0A2P8F2U4_9RHOB|nr:hypothetical protein CLV88_1232 [Shimia abyssi]